MAASPILRFIAACAAAGTLAMLSACGSMSGIATPDRYAAIVDSPDRAPADRVNDLRRKPREMLVFIGVKPGATALDLSAGRGYTSELIARSVGATGRVYAQTPPRDPARTPPAQAEGQAAPAAAPSPNVMPTLAERASRMAHIVPVQRRFEDPVPPEAAAAGLDLVTLMFNYHDLGHLNVDRAAMNAAVFRSMKPGGVYVIADHAGRSGTGISESGTLHRVEEEFVVREVQAAGFRLSERGSFLRNPADPRDRNTPEPAMPKDEFVLKFVKP